jgi:hypothetical protein
LDISLDEDRSRLRNANAALVLGMFRRLVVSVAQAAIAQVQTKKTRWSVRRYQQQFAHRDGGPERLRALVFAKAPYFLEVKKMKRRVLPDGQWRALPSLTWRVGVA